MQREAARTLYSLSDKYQRNVSVDEWEVIVIDNGSNKPVSKSFVESFGINFRYYYNSTHSVSPVSAVNIGVKMSKSKRVSICIDGARISSPSIVYWSIKAFDVFPDPIVCTIGWHLGPESQNLSVPNGYDKKQEDQLLEKIDWKNNGYKLFSISSLARSKRYGWFGPDRNNPTESNFLSLYKKTFDSIGGFNENFQSPGGGLVNLDFLKVACERPGTKYVILLGEGTFHQVHGGVATNVSMDEHPWEKFHAEYVEVRGKPYSFPGKSVNYFGHMPTEAIPFLLIPDTVNSAEQ